MARGRGVRRFCDISLTIFWRRRGILWSSYVTADTQIGNSKGIILYLMCHGIINRKSIDCVILYFIIEVLFIRQKAYGSTPCESSFLLTIDHRFIVTFSVYVRVCVNMFLHHVCSMISFVRQKLDIVLRNTGGRAKLKCYVSLHRGGRDLKWPKLSLRSCWCPLSKTTFKFNAQYILYYKIQSVCVCMSVRNRPPNHAYYDDGTFTGDSVDLRSATKFYF